MDKEKQKDQLLSERYHLEEEMADNKREINKFEELVADYQFYQAQEKKIIRRSSLY